MQAPRSGPRASRASLIQWFGWAAVAGLLGAALIAPVSATAGAAPGNNGTVKIHEGGTETEPIVRNEPHVCTFHLHFFFSDPFQAGSWEIQEWAPTGEKGTVVLSGTYDTNGDGEDRDPDEPGVYELPDGHYKLFWDGDTGFHDKMKVFWVDCEPEAETEGPTFQQSQEGETDAPSNPPSEAASVPPSFQQSQEGETDAPSNPPSEAASVPPSIQQSQPGETDTPSFGQSVGGFTEAPTVNLTQAPTDMLQTAAPDTEGWRWLLVAMAALLAMVLVLTPSPERIRRR